ncbi:MAG: hypothetical protein KZQ76_03560 [Candidatus Thiodiazotropha sp. (ex Epidulcina cf. delphinae)]|nr:hypothetical protein [Candidatus Thiodiazotropha sp. (ex Epidulcina cf. delphinae)]
MTNPPLSPTRMAAIGMDQRQRNALHMLFSTKCDNRYVLMEEDASEICILDLDVFGGERLWEEFRERHPQRPLILVSLKAREISDDVTLFVEKPIPVDRLIDAIEQQRRHLSAKIEDLAQPPPPDTSPRLAEQAEQPDTQQPPRKKRTARKAASLMSESMEWAFVGTSPDIDPKDPQQLAKIYYNPEHYLQGHMQLALNLAARHNKNVGVEGPWPAIRLYFEGRKIRVSAEERQLRPYCTIPDAILKVPLRFLDEEENAAGGAREYSIDAFHWQLALWASRGRLPKGTDLFRPVYLRRWPNFTRLVVTPYALAIAALWAEQPRSLIDTAQTLNIPQRYVFAFYSAAKAIQMAGETRCAADTLPAPSAVEKPKHRGLLRRLMGRLRGDKKQI